MSEAVSTSHFLGRRNEVPAKSELSCTVLAGLGKAGWLYLLITKLLQKRGVGSGEKTETREKGHSKMWPDPRRQVEEVSRSVGAF